MHYALNTQAQYPSWLVPVIIAVLVIAVISFIIALWGK